MNNILQGIEAARLSTSLCEEGELFEGRYSFPDSFSGFAGHFPGHPILPAIVQIMTVISLLTSLTGQKLRLANVEDSRFLRPVSPDEELSVQCRRKIVKGKHLFDATLQVGETVSATMLLELAVCGEDL